MWTAWWCCLAALAIWDPVPHPDLAGYRVYYGDTSGVYHTFLEVGLVTSVAVEGLVEGQTYYFAATAYTTAGEESDYSNEVAYTVPVLPSLPIVTIIHPLDGALVPRKTPLTIEADAHAEGGVAQVEIFVRNHLLCTPESAPYRCEWQVPAARQMYQLQALAYDHDGQVGTSPIVTVTAR
jgi:hypothetical protein